MTLNKKIISLRKLNKLSQERLAELVGVSRQAVSKWETGLSNPDTENLVRLAKIFNVTMDDLTDTVIDGEKVIKKEKKSAIHFRIFQPIVTYTGFMVALRTKTNVSGYYIFISMVILISGIFMAWNIWSEPDIKQRRRNIYIEFGYCLLTYIIMAVGTATIGNIFSGIISIVCCCIYLSIVNPQYMGRKIFN